MEAYNHRAIEDKWQGDNKIEYPQSKGEKYILEMLPYPSGKVHMGHVRNYTLGDVYARYLMMNGYKVLHPMGWDSFGLPAENAAKQFGVNPSVWTQKNIDEMRDEMKRCGLSYDWSREISTCEPYYYKHEQEFFINFYNHGLIYQKESPVNWDPVDKTVLANEQVINGRGWRSGAVVEKKNMKQWFCKITDFAQDLLDGLDSLEKWPDSIKTMQRNWIGRSEGAIIKFKLCDSDKYIEVYTTRQDTIFGCSFIGISYNHSILNSTNHSADVESFIKECSLDSISEAVIETKEKKGVATGLFVEHPFDKNKKIPVYIANFVLSTYGTGAVFGCPAHDARDYEFAKKYDLPILQVIEGEADCYGGDGVIINSEFLNGMHNLEAKHEVVRRLEEIGCGQSKINYRLHDWSISRQKYWGCPIPMINCPSCGSIPVRVEDLPVTLPSEVDFTCQGNPLASHPTWKNVECHICSANAERETDTLDTFFESSWYFAKYCTTDRDQGISRIDIERWMPVDCYIGGPEHAVMHLLYARFFTRALKKLGYWDIEEPFIQLYTQGMVCNKAYKDINGLWVAPSDIENRDGGYYSKISGIEVFAVGSEKMSKSKKNGIEPREYIDRYGADTIRMFVLSDSPPDKDLDWNDNAVVGVHRYLHKLYKTITNDGDYSLALERLRHKTIAFVTQDYKDFHINKAIARVRELNNAMNEHGSLKQQLNVLETIVQLLHPIVPHITAEIAERYNYKLVWPEVDMQFLVNDNVTIVVQVNGKLRGTIDVQNGILEAEIKNIAFELQPVKNAIGSNPVKKIIYVKDKILNFIC
jgi:leucyl-tRNA synthetase